MSVYNTAAAPRMSKSTDLVQSGTSNDVRLDLRQVIRSNQRGSIRNQQIPIIFLLVSKDVTGMMSDKTYTVPLRSGNVLLLNMVTLLKSAPEG